MSPDRLSALKARLTQKNLDLAELAEEVRDLTNLYVAEAERQMLPGTVHHLFPSSGSPEAPDE